MTNQSASNSIATTKKEELVNVWTHGFGILITLLGIPFLIYSGLKSGNFSFLIGLSIFSLSLLLVYIISTTYHYIERPKLKYTFQVIDHISIYFLIAGTHTPLLLYYLNNSTGWFYLIILWSMVLFGTLYKLFFFGKYQLLSVIFYLIMGWMAVFTVPPMLGQMSTQTLIWIIVGGAFYTFGVPFFLWEKLPFNHAIWHLFVLAGSAGHFIALWSISG